MMRKTAKKLFCIGLALATLFLSACEDPTFEELIPESYGAWEGNYIYRGNVRSKTTGENPERYQSLYVF